MSVLTSNRIESGMPEATAEVLSRIWRRRPHVHCITNSVAQNFTANTLLAVGAVPSMTIASEEVAEFVARSDALVVNLGTLDAGRRQAGEIGAQVATERQLPWVLDPVFVDRSSRRIEFARKLMGRGPTVLRLNSAEFEALAGTNLDDGRLKQYALARHCVVALTGITDIVTDGARLVRIENGHPLMGRVTAIGCAATALVAACLAVEVDAWRATAAGLLAFAIAGECAADRARGPGTFSIEIIDSLANLDPENLLARAKVR